ADGWPHASERALERGEGSLVAAQREERRAQADHGIRVVRIPVEGGPERGEGQAQPAEAEAAPAQPVVEALPRRLPPERSLERDDRPPEITEEVLGPPEERSSLVMIWIEAQGLAQALAGLFKLPRLEEGLAAREGRLCLQAPAKALDEA